jgi:hypothetical protein
MVDFVLLRTGPVFVPCEFILFKSADSSTQSANIDFYRDATFEVIKELNNRRIIVHSIVGDGLSPQLTALSHEAKDSLQNCEALCSRLPSIGKIDFIYCSCHRARGSCSGTAPLGKHALPT